MACAVIFAAIATLVVVAGQGGNVLTDSWLDSMAANYQNDWEDIVRYLNMPETQITAIKMTKGYTELDKAKKALKTWRDSNPQTNPADHSQYTSLMNAITYVINAKSEKPATGARPIKDLFLYNDLMEIVELLNETGQNEWRNVVLRLPGMRIEDINVMISDYSDSTLRQALHALELWANRFNTRLSDLAQKTDSFTEDDIDRIKADTLIDALKRTGNQKVVDHIEKHYKMSDAVRPTVPTTTIIYIPGTNIQGPTRRDLISNEWLAILARHFASDWVWLAENLGIATIDIDSRKRIQASSTEHALWALERLRDASNLNLQEKFSRLTRVIQDFYRNQIQIPDYLSDHSFITVLSNGLGVNWQTFFIMLGLSPEDISMIRQRNPQDNLAELIRKLFLMWRDSSTRSRTYKNNQIHRVLQNLNLLSILNNPSQGQTPTYTDYLSDQYITVLSNGLGVNWQKFFLMLGLSQEDISRISQRNPQDNLAELIRKLFIMWRDSPTRSRTYKNNQIHRVLQTLNLLSILNNPSQGQTPTYTGILSNGGLRYIANQLSPMYWKSVLDGLNPGISVQDRDIEALVRALITWRDTTQGTVNDLMSRILSAIADADMTLVNTLDSIYIIPADIIQGVKSSRTVNTGPGDSSGIAGSNVPNTLDTVNTLITDNQPVDPSASQAGNVPSQTYQGLLSDNAIGYLADQLWTINWQPILERMGVSPMERNGIRNRDDLLRILRIWRGRRAGTNVDQLLLQLLSAIAEVDINLVNQLRTIYTIPDNVVAGIKTDRRPAESFTREGTTIVDTAMPVNQGPQMSYRPINRNNLLQSLNDLAYNLGKSWVKVAPRLNLSDRQILAILSTNDNPADQALKALEQWNRETPDSANKIDLLLDALSILKPTYITGYNPSMKKHNDIFLYDDIKRVLGRFSPEQRFRLAAYLGVPESVINKAKNDYPDYETQAIHLLQYWYNHINVQPEEKVKYFLYGIKDITKNDDITRQNVINYLNQNYEGVKDLYNQLPNQMPMMPALSVGTTYPTVPKGQLTDEYLEGIAESIKIDWQRLAKYLMVPQSEIEKFRIANTNVKQQALLALKYWRNKSSSAGIPFLDQYNQLIAALNRYNNRATSTLDNTDYLSEHIITKLAERLNQNWENFVIYLGVSRTDLDYIKANFPLPQWIPRALYKWTNEYKDLSIPEKNARMKNALTTYGLLSIVNPVQKPTTTKPSNLFTIPEITNIVNRLRTQSNQFTKDWKSLVKYLGLGDRDINKMENYYPTETLRAVHAIELWSNRVGIDNDFIKFWLLSNSSKNAGLTELVNYIDKTYGPIDLTKVPNGYSPQNRVIYIPGTDIPKPATITSDFLDRLAGIFSRNWKPVARELGLLPSDITTIDQRPITSVDKAREALRVWWIGSEDNIDTQFSFLTRLIHDFHRTQFSPDTKGPSRQEFINRETTIMEPSTGGRPDQPTYPSGGDGRPMDTYDATTTPVPRKTIDNNRLRNISKGIEKHWIQIVRKLGLPEYEINRINQREVPRSEKAYLGLVAWQRLSPDYTRNILLLRKTLADYINTLKTELKQTQDKPSTIIVDSDNTGTVLIDQPINRPSGQKFGPDNIGTYPGDQAIDQPGQTIDQTSGPIDVPDNTNVILIDPPIDPQIDQPYRPIVTPDNTRPYPIDPINQPIDPSGPITGPDNIGTISVDQPANEPNRPMFRPDITDITDVTGGFPIDQPGPIRVPDNIGNQPIDRPSGPRDFPINQPIDQPGAMTEPDITGTNPVDRPVDQPNIPIVRQDNTDNSGQPIDQFRPIVGPDSSGNQPIDQHIGPIYQPDNTVSFPNQPVDQTGGPTGGSDTTGATIVTSRIYKPSELFNDEGLGYLASMLGRNWKVILRELKVPDWVITQYENRYLNNDYLQAKHTLKWWLSSVNDDNSRIRFLFDALRRQNREDDVQSIKNLYRIKETTINTQPQQPEDLFKDGGLNYLASFFGSNWKLILRELVPPYIITQYEYGNQPAKDVLGWWLERTLNTNTRIRLLLDALKKHKYDVQGIKDIYQIKDIAVDPAKRPIQSGTVGSTDLIPNRPTETDRPGDNTGTNFISGIYPLPLPTPATPEVRPGYSATGEEHKPGYISNVMMQQIAKVIQSRWQDILSALGLLNGDIARIEEDNPNMRQLQANIALIEWRDKFTNGVSNSEKRQRLINVLDRWKYLDLVAELSKKKPGSALFLYPGLRTLMYFLQKPDSEGIPAWMYVVKQLGITQDEINTLERYYPGQPLVQGANHLLKWINRFPGSEYEMYEELKKVLKNHPSATDHIQNTYNMTGLSQKASTLIPQLPTRSPLLRRQDILSEPGLRYIVRMFGDGWQNFLRSLNFDVSQVSSYPAGEQFYQALRLWRERTSGNDETKIQLLLDALTNAQKPNIVDTFKKEVDEFFTPEGFEDLASKISNIEDIRRFIGQLGLRYQPSESTPRDQLINDLLYWYRRTSGSHDAVLQLIFKALQNINKPETINYIKRIYKVKDPEEITDVAKVNLDDHGFAAFRKQERVIDEENVPKDLLSDKILMEIGDRLGNDWRTLAIRLGLTGPEIDSIRYGPADRKPFRALKMWLAKQSDRPKYIILKEALTQLGLSDLLRYLNQQLPLTVNQTPTNIDQAIASMAAQFNGTWEPLAKTLGFYEKEIEKIKSDHPDISGGEQHRARQRLYQIIQMLTTWNLRSKDTDAVKIQKLKKALKDHKQKDALNILNESTRTQQMNDAWHMTRKLGLTTGQRYEQVLAGKGMDNPPQNYDYQFYRNQGWTSNEGLKEIAIRLRYHEWRALASALGLKDPQINDIAANYSTTEGAALAALKIWREKITHPGPTNTGSKPKELYDALGKLNYTVIRGYMERNFAERACIDKSCTKDGCIIKPLCEANGTRHDGCIAPCYKLQAGNYQSCYSCEIFIQCNWGTMHVHDCPIGTEYDDITKTCVYRGESKTCSSDNYFNNINSYNYYNTISLNYPNTITYQENTIG